MAKPTVNMPDELETEVETQLSYGDSKSGWIRDAITLRLEVDPLLDDRFGDHEADARREFVKEAVEEKLDRETDQ